MYTLVALLALPVLSGRLPAGSASASAVAAPHAPRALPEISVTWVGDITPGSRYGLPPEEGRALFAGVRDSLRRSDLALGNLEGTYSVGGASKCGTDGGNCFSFQAPPSYARALAWAGFDLVNLANNHAFDFGEDGQLQTLAALQQAGVAETGKPEQVRFLDVRGARVAVLGFAPYPWAADLRDLPRARELIRYADKRADFVIVLMHAGGEGSDQTHVPIGREHAMGEDRGDTRAFAHAAVDSGADLVLGSGPHVLRGIEQRRGRLIAYSLGNFAGYRNFSTAGDLALSGILHVRLSPSGETHRAELESLRLDGDGVPRPDPEGAAAALVGRLSTKDFGQTAPRMDRAGSITSR